MFQRKGSAVRAAKVVLATLFLFFALTLIGCAAMNRAFPSATDINGTVIAGTHSAPPLATTAAGMLPFGIGDILLTGGLLIWNGIERFRANKTGKGLKSTLTALNKVKNDPELRNEWEKIKAIMESEHTIDNVQPIIQAFLDKIKAKKA